MLVKFLDDAALVAEVSHLLTVAEEAVEAQRKEFGKNVIDPFAAMFEMAGFGMDHAGWVNSELMRQAQKTLLNHIGGFHQNILGSVAGWENMNTGSVVDLVSEKHRVIAEVKNKHNTLSGGKRSDQYSNLEKLVMQKASRYHGYTAYFVTVIPKSPERFDRPFTPSEKETGAKVPENELIREIDGASFYELVTGEKDALGQLFAVLPKVVEGITDRKTDAADRAALNAYFSNAFGA
ncbi:Eco47II family restriction endonuclease [Akkermansiaceae bacterium]|nr:Eco47II family restriction endonuclease [Akkermansiaceae bacterium]